LHFFYPSLSLSPLTSPFFSSISCAQTHKPHIITHNFCLENKKKKPNTDKSLHAKRNIKPPINESDIILFLSFSLGEASAHKHTIDGIEGRPCTTIKMWGQPVIYQCSVVPLKAADLENKTL
jgi:hypothetical protein